MWSVGLVVKVGCFMSDANKAFSLARMARHDANALRAMLDPALVVDAIFGFHAQQAVDNRVEIIAEIKGFLDLIEQKIGYR